jgi:hypothetical protein
VDELLPFALGAAAVAVLGPARRRVVPVAKAVGRAGLAVTGATVVGVSGVVNAVIRGERKGESKKAEPAAATS